MSIDDVLGVSWFHGISLIISILQVKLFDVDVGDMAKGLSSSTGFVVELPTA